MGLETGNTINDLNESWPLGTDPKSQGDDHIRLIKSVLQNDALSLSEGGTITGDLTINGAFTSKGIDDNASSKALTISNNGYLLMGTASAVYTERLLVRSNGSTYAGTFMADASATAPLVVRQANGVAGSRAQINFVYDATSVGSITSTGTATAFNTSSDYRLKEDIKPMTDATTRLMSLNPVNFAWKADGSRVDGFIAHEAQAVVPEAVTGEKDAVDAEGNPEYQGIDQSKLVPLLVATVQELVKRINDLVGNP